MNMEIETKAQFEKLAVMVANGFVDMRGHVDQRFDKVDGDIAELRSEVRSILEN